MWKEQMRPRLPVRVWLSARLREDSNSAISRNQLNVICARDECRYTFKDNKHNPVRALNIHREDKPS